MHPLSARAGRSKAFARVKSERALPAGRATVARCAIAVALARRVDRRRLRKLGRAERRRQQLTTTSAESDSLDVDARRGSAAVRRVARRRADLARRLPRPAGADQRLVVVVKHLPERGGRLRRVRREPPGDRVRRDQRRGHARRGRGVRRALRLVMGVDAGPGAGARPQPRRRRTSRTSSSSMLDGGIVDTWEGGGDAAIWRRDAREAPVNRWLGSVAVSSTERRYSAALPATWLAARLAVDPARIDAMRRAGELIASPRARLDGVAISGLAVRRRAGHGRPSRASSRRRARAGVDEARLYEVLTAPLGLRGERHARRPAARGPRRRGRRGRARGR